MKGRPESYIYYWLGNSAGTAAETATAFQTVQLDTEVFNGDATQIRVIEGKEPSHLIAMFNGGMAVLQSGNWKIYFFSEIETVVSVQNLSP